MSYFHGLIDFVGDHPHFAFGAVLLLALSEAVPVHLCANEFVSQLWNQLVSAVCRSDIEKHILLVAPSEQA